MADTATVTGYGTKHAARSTAIASAQPYLDQGYQITNETFIPEAGMSGCMLVLILVILFVTIIGIFFLPFLLMGGKKGTYSITLTKFQQAS